MNWMCPCGWYWGPVRKQHTPVLGLDSSSRPFIFLCRKMKDYFFWQGNLNAQSESFMSRQVRAWRCSQRTSLIYSLSHNSKWVIATMYWDNGSNHWIQIDHLERFRVHKCFCFNKLYSTFQISSCCWLLPLSQYIVAITHFELCESE